MHSSRPTVHHCCKFGENRTNTFQDIVLTTPESAVSSILYSTMTLTFDLLTRVHLCMDARTQGRTGQKQYASGHTTLGGGIKRSSSISSMVKITIHFR